MAMRLTTVVVEALDVQAQASFWAQALLGDDMSVEVSRLLEAGASRVDIELGRTPQEMLADPEGNEFRVLTPR